MRFAHPVFLLLALAALPLVGWILARFERARRAALASFASDRLLGRLAASVSQGRRTVKRTLLVAGIATLLLAFARPQWGWHEEEVKRRGVDLLFAVDTSKSMLAQDVRPNRLDRAKLAVLDLLDRLEGDRVGLIAFAGTAFLQCPLTLDHDAFRLSLDTLDTNVIPKGGTDLASAIREAMEALKAGATGQKILVLLTDGEDLEPGALAAARDAAKEGLRIFTVGVGTTSGEIIPSPTDPAAFVKDPEGRVVKSRLDEKILTEIASITGGIYQPLGPQGAGLLTVYQRGLASLPRAELLSRTSRIPIERFPWVLGLGLLLLATEWLLGDRRRAPGHPKGTARALTAATLAIAGFAASSAHAALWSAENAYKEGRFQDALAEYQKAVKSEPKSPEVQFNLGAASYRSGEFAPAAEAFLKSATTAKTPELAPKALYNLGNSLYRAGQATEKTNPDQTIQAWENALKAWEQSLKMKRDDADAKFNCEYVKKKLEELKKQQEKKDPSKDQQKDQQKDPQQKQDPSSSGQDSASSPQKPQPSSQDQSKEGKDREDANRNKDGAPKPQPQNDGKEPKPQPSSPKKPEKGDGREPQTGATQPGQMTPEEAKALLDALRGDERKMPLSVDRMGRGPSKDEPTKRDW